MLRCSNVYLITEADKAVTLQCGIIIKRDLVQTGENGQWNDIHYFIAIEAQLLKLF